MKYLNFKLLIFFAALALAIPPAWAKTAGFSLAAGGTVPIAANANPATGTITGDQGETWNVAIEGTFSSSSFQGTNGNRYWQMGKSKASIDMATFSTSGITGTITKIVVNCASATSAGGSLSVEVNNRPFSNSPSQMPVWSSNVGGDVEFTGNASGTISVKMFPQSGKACYIKSITVTYEENTPSPTGPWITVNPSSLTINDVVGENNKFVVSAGNIRDFQNLSVASDNDKFSVIGVPAEGSGNSWATWGGFNSNSNHTVDGTVTVTYGGTELIANGNVVCGTLDAESKSVAVNYRSDLYIVNNNGQGANGWNFNEGIPMTYADNVYTGTITTTNPDTKIVFARMLGNGVGWNSRLVFGAQSNDDWKYGPNTEGNLNVDDDVAIWFPEAGVYTITIDPTDKTFSITSTSVNSIQEAYDFENGQFTFMGNAVVTYKKGSNLWIRDDSGSGLIYQSGLSNFVNGDVLDAGWKAETTEHNGIPEFQNASGIKSSTNNGGVQPIELTSLEAGDVNKYVSMNNLTVTRVDDQNYYFEIDNVEFCMRDNFNMIDNALMQKDHVYNIIGAVTIYQNKPQLYLFEADDVTPAMLTVTLDPAEESAYTGKTIEVTVTTNPEADFQATCSDANATVTNNSSGFTITSNTPGTYTVSVYATDGELEKTVTGTYTFTQAPDPTGEIFEKVTSNVLVDGGRYILVYESGPAAMGAVGQKGDPVTGILLDTDKSPYQVDLAGKTVTILTAHATETTGRYAFEIEENKYLGYGSSTNFVTSKPVTELAAQWDVQTDGSLINASTVNAPTVRAIVYRAGTTNKFGPYATSNVNNTEYFLAYLYKEVTATPQPELAVTLPDAPAEHYKVGRVVKVKATVENGSENTKLTYKVGDETLTIGEDGNVTLPNKKAGNVVLTVTAEDGDKQATDSKTYVFDAADALAITLTPASGSFYVGDEQNVTVTVEGAIEANPTITYKFGEEGEAQNYTETGIVLPTTQAGTINLIVMVNDNGYEHTGANENGISTATGTYTVNNKPLTVTLDPATKTYVVGKEAKVKVEFANVVGEVVATYKVGDSETEKDVPADGYIILDNDKAVENMTVIVTAVDDRLEEVTATGTYTFTAAPTITFDLVANPAQDTYTVGKTVNVKVANVQNNIGDYDITYTLTDAREGEQTYDDTKGIDITSDKAGTVTLTVTIEDLYEHAAEGTKSAEYKFVKAGVITITFDPASGAEFNVGDPNAKVKVTIAGAAEDYLAEYTVGDDEVTPDNEGYIPLPNAAAVDVTLTVTVDDGVEHEGEVEGVTTASAVYHFVKQNATVAFDVETANAVIGTAFDAPVATTTPAGLDVTYESSDETVATVNASTGVVAIVGEGTTTITATVVGNNLYNGGATASYTLTVAPQPVVATPVITPNGGSYSADQPVNITCATEGATILYSLNGTNYTEGNSLTVRENCTVYAKATKAGSIDSQVAQATFKFEKPETPVGPTLKGYYQIKNNANGEYVNVLGRKTLRFTTNPADQAGSVIYVETENGQVQSLRSQAADLQGYADRAMRYVPEVVQLVVDKLHAAGSGEVLGEHGYDEIMAAFNESFDYHLYVEQGDKGYRLYGKTPSMQPVVDFYRSHKDQVDAKLPMIEGFINEAIEKILQKTNGSGQSILVPYDIHEVWSRMGGADSGLTEPKDDATDLAFYQEVLNDKDNVWNFAYQSVMIYWEKLKNHPQFQQMMQNGALGEYANYINKLEQIRPNAKYYVIQTDGKPDYVSDGNALILSKDDCTYWTLEPRTEFTVNFPADTKYGDQYVTTLYTDFAYTVPEGVTAYKVTAVDEQGLAQIEALTSPIAAQTPVLLMAQANGRAEVAKTLTIAESGNAVDGTNLLVGPDFLINEFEIPTEQVQALFDLVKGHVNSDFYNQYVAPYEHLILRNAGTVNNKYFWGLSEDDLLNYCSYKEDGMDACDVRSLDVADGKIAFINNLTVATNKAFLMNKADVINLAVVETPVITPVPENPYTAPVEVTITCATEGATILYTTDGGEHWTEYIEPFTLNETTTVQAYATKAGLGDSEKTEEVEYVIELPVATPVVTPEGGSYGSAQTVKITCDTPDAVISYSTDGGKTWTEYTEPFTVDTDCTITVKAEKAGMTPSETSVSYVFEIQPAPITMDALKGYFYIKNNGTENYANVQGRKTLHFTSAPEDQAGTVFYVETNENGQVQSLRSQAADLQGYADRAMGYVPKLVQIVVNKLNATGSGNILGEHGYDEIMAAFNASFDHHLYVEPTNKGENVYRLYAKTPSMQPVVDFYRSHKDQVDAKLPMLEGFINTAIHKILEKTNGIGSGILENYDIHKVWEAMGGENSGLTEPADDAEDPANADSAADLAFYQEVLNNKDNVWNFAYQSVMIYWNNLMNNTTFQERILPMLGNDAQYLENLTQIRPNTKYYVIENGNEPDYVSENNVYITDEQPKTYWTLEPRSTFKVNVPATFPYRGQYVTTLYTDFAYSLPENEKVSAYKVKGISDKGVVDIEKLEGPIAAQTPVLLMANEAGVKTLTIAESGNAVEGNLLVGPDFLIERDSILTDQIAALFGFAKDILNEEFYENNVKQYEHLMFRTAGTVNNKYFWGLSEEDLITYCLKDGEDDTDIRSLGVENKTAAFCEHWTVEMNKAFLIDETKELETLVLPVKDITRDGIWDIEDATALIDILLYWPNKAPNDTGNPGWDYEAADFDLSGEIDIVDATALIDYLLFK